MIDTIVRYAWEDQHPKGADLQQAARDSVIRYARHFGLNYRWHHDQRGQRWTRSAKAGRFVPQRVFGWRSEAIVTGRAAR